jgi:hypothetical protein
MVDLGGDLFAICCRRWKLRLLIFSAGWGLRETPDHSLRPPVTSGLLLSDGILLPFDCSYWLLLGKNRYLLGKNRYLTADKMIKTTKCRQVLLTSLGIDW